MKKSKAAGQKLSEAGQKEKSKETPVASYEETLSHTRNLILTWAFDDRPWIRDEVADQQQEKDRTEIQIDEVLVKAKLEEHFSTNPPWGTNVIRRALVELAYEQLIEIRPKEGTFIRLIKPDELSQLLKTRSVLEELIVCSIARDNSPKVYERLKNARDINERIRKLPLDPNNFVNPAELLGKVLDEDMAFHEELALVAGFDHLKTQLRSIRNRLRLASRKVVTTAPHVKKLAEDHDAILLAIRSDGEAWLGDIDRARLAMKTHLRNAVRRLHLTARITDRDDYENDPMMDLPAQLSEKNAGSPLALGVLRLLLELLVVAELSDQDTSGRLLVPLKICQSMSEIAKEWEGKDEVDASARAAFVSKDMLLHSSLAYISGLLFAQEALVHVWQRMYQDAKRNMTGDQMVAVVNEHYEIVTAIGYLSGVRRKEGGLKKILDAVCTHFYEAQIRLKNNSLEIDEDGKSTSDDDDDDGNPVPKEVRHFLEWFKSQIK